MRIAYIATCDHQDVGNWSGLTYFIHKCLRDKGFDVDVLGPFPAYSHIRRHWILAKTFWYNHLLRGKLGMYSPERDHHVAQAIGRQIEIKLNEKCYDLIVSPGAPPIAYVKTEVPIAIWADATFHSLVTSYPEYKLQTRSYYREGECLERRALQNATFCCFSSDWAARSAQNDYEIEPEKIIVIPFGANVDDELDESEIRCAIARRDRQCIRLLFVGVDFDRKGGPKVFEILSELLRLGIAADLRVLGCWPNVPDKLKPHIQILGFVSKKTLEGRRAISDCFLTSHWLILLPLAECYGLVFAEANRYGVPCIASNVGGIPTIIADGFNGKLFDPISSPHEIAQYIIHASADSQRYVKMATNSQQEYRTRLNWNKAGEALATLFHTHVRSVGTSASETPAGSAETGN